MQKLTGKVVSVHTGDEDAFESQGVSAIEAELSGIRGDRHQSFERKTWPGDKQAAGTVRRNERQWSAVSIEELAEISDEMRLATPLTAAELGANLCLSGIAELSRLPKGTLLSFESGAVLMVEEYNPPCLDMGTNLAEKHRKRSGEPLAATDFSKVAKLKRGVVGVVEVPGTISEGDPVQIDVYESPAWLARSVD